MIRVLCINNDKKLLKEMEMVVKEILPFSDNEFNVFSSSLGSPLIVVVNTDLSSFLSV